MAFAGKESAAYFADGEPKFPFVGRIIEAYYTSPKLDNICVVHNYEVPDDGVHTDAQGNPNGGEMSATVYNISVADNEIPSLLEWNFFSCTLELKRGRERERERECFI